MDVGTVYRQMLKAKGIDYVSKEILQMRHIDPHVHDRDWEQAYKATVLSTMTLARSQGIVAIITMPNTSPAITTPALVARKLLTVTSQGCLEGYYLNIGATKDPDQVRQAMRLAKNNSRIAGIKLYAGETTGDLKLIEETEQRMVFRVAAEEDFTGVICVHCEKHSLERPKLWVPEHPATWNDVKSPETEIEAVKDIIRFAREEGFKEHLHICHTSTPEAVELVNDAKKFMSISCCTTPHHLIFSTDDMQTPDGIMLKVNPPIRDIKRSLKLMDLLRTGAIDWIETDNAWHSLKEKTYVAGRDPNSYPSGIPSLVGYAAFLQMLVDKERFTMQMISDLTYNNIKRAYPKIRE